MSYYKILNISNDAFIKEIKKVYKKAVLKYHPDKNSGNYYLTSSELYELEYIHEDEI
ncbi:2659_t:CDS:2, partial [Scutellospora calospora]